jgi:hypothetical protein
MASNGQPMAADAVERIEDQVFKAGDVVILDGKHFSRCTFDGCKVVYAGGYAGFEHCLWGNCAYSFTEAAYRTGGLLATLGFLRPEVEVLFSAGSEKVQ